MKEGFSGRRRAIKSTYHGRFYESVTRLFGPGSCRYRSFGGVCQGTLSLRRDRGKGGIRNRRRADDRLSTGASLDFNFETFLLKLEFGQI